jgi:hypothetical protein
MYVPWLIVPNMAESSPFPFYLRPSNALSRNSARGFVTWKVRVARFFSHVTDLGVTESLEMFHHNAFSVKPEHKLTLT